MANMMTKLIMLAVVFISGCIEYPDVTIYADTTYVQEVTTVNNVTYVTQATDTTPDEVTQTTEAEPEPVRFPVIMY